MLSGAEWSQARPSVEKLPDDLDKDRGPGANITGMW
jgi:hypothetical protein